MRFEPRVLLVGLGRQGSEHLESARELQREGRLKIAGVCDIDKDFAARKGREFLVDYYDNYKQADKAVKPNIAILALPNFKYDEIRNYFLEKGINVLQEKPASMGLKGAKLAQRLAIANKCYFRVAQQRLYHPFFIKAKEWIGRIGKISFYDYAFTLNDVEYS